MKRTIMTTAILLAMTSACDSDKSKKVEDKDASAEKVDAKEEPKAEEKKEDSQAAEK